MGLVFLLIFNKSILLVDLKLYVDIINKNSIAIFNFIISLIKYNIYIYKLLLCR